MLPQSMTQLLACSNIHFASSKGGCSACAACFLRRRTVQAAPGDSPGRAGLTRPGEVAPAAGLFPPPAKGLVGLAPAGGDCTAGLCPGTSGLWPGTGELPPAAIAGLLTSCKVQRWAGLDWRPSHKSRLTAHKQSRLSDASPGRGCCHPQAGTGPQGMAHWGMPLPAT